MKLNVSGDELRELPKEVLKTLVGFEVDENVFLYGHQGKENFNIGKVLEKLDLYTNGKWAIQTHALTRTYRFQGFDTAASIDSEWHIELIDALWESLIKSVS